MHDCDGHWFVPLAEPIEWRVGGRDRRALDWVATRLWVEPHYPFHVGCCRPELKPWWVAEREEHEREQRDREPTDQDDEATEGR